MYSEMGFIFNPSLEGFNNKDNTGNIYQRDVKIRPSTTNQNVGQGQNVSTNTGIDFTGGGVTNPIGQTSSDPVDNSGVLVYKDPKASGTANIINYLKSSVYSNDDTNEDPYISLIRYFDGRKSKAMRLRAADFAYLKDLGVYPINRLWILRRFPDNCIVPNNLLGWGNNGIEPISTVVGWIKDQENTPLLSVSFNEVWVDQNQMLDKVISEILKDNFGIKSEMIMSVPGWSQGILFGMLKAMGLTGEFDATNVPTGDPNVLRVAKMREINSQALQSRINVTLETTYEQKYINGIDPGMAMLDIWSNLLKMGTSDQKFILDASSKLVQQFVGNVYSKSNNAVAWIDFIKELIKAFISGITTFFNELTGAGAVTGGSSTGTNDNAGGTSSSQAAKSSVGFTIPDTTSIKGTLGSVSTMLGKLSSSILAGTISKYRWPLKGSIALMSGINTTPWHLTIGNPYSPIVNIGNIVVSNVETKWSNDLGFNDVPARLDVSISADFGRPLGKQELEKMFNNQYKRVYSTKQFNSIMDSIAPSSSVAPSGEPANAKVPEGTKIFYNRSVNTLP